MKETNLIRSITSLILILFLLIPGFSGEPDSYNLSQGSHRVIVLKKLDSSSRQNTRIPYELNGKEEESRSEKSTHHSYAYTISVHTHFSIHQHDHTLTFNSSRVIGRTAKVPRYLTKHALLI